MLVSDGRYRNQWGEGGWGRGQAGSSERTIWRANASVKRWLLRTVPEGSGALLQGDLNTDKSC